MLTKIYRDGVGGMGNIKVSVIIPVYNCELFLQDCIDSLMNQTLKGIECIFVDDASTDSSLKILYENKQKYGEIFRVVEFHENKKQGAARNEGLRMAIGKYIAFVDADDVVAPDMFEILYEKAECEHADIVKVNFARIDESQKYNTMNFALMNFPPEFKWNDALFEINTKEELDQNDRNNLYAYGIGSVCGGVFLKQIIEEHALWFPEGVVYEDNYWGTQIISYIKKICFMENVLYYYRKNSNSTVSSGNLKNLEDRIYIERSLISYFQQKDFGAFSEGLTFRFIKLTENSFALGLRVSPKFKVFTGILYPYLEDIEKCFPNWRENKYLKAGNVDMKQYENIMDRGKWFYAYTYYKYKLITGKPIQALLKLRHWLRSTK